MTPLPLGFPRAALGFDGSILSTVKKQKGIDGKTHRHKDCPVPIRTFNIRKLRHLGGI